MRRRHPLVNALAVAVAALAGGVGSAALLANASAAAQETAGKPPPTSTTTTSTTTTSTTTNTTTAAQPAATTTTTTTTAPPAGPVSVFPIVGSQVASPQTQIAFRGVDPSLLTGVQVSGSESGPHSGTVMADSDRQGGSFIPAAPFDPGETVTVTTGLDLVGAPSGTYQFKVASPGGKIYLRKPPTAPRVPGDLWHFPSRHDLVPAAVEILTHSRVAGPGDLFLAPEYGPVQNGPMILDPYGNLIWFKPLPKYDIATDFRVQSYRGQPVLTWWQGYTDAGTGVGVDEIYDSSYQQIATVSAANGLSADLHEFQLTRQGTALISAYYPVHWNATSVGGSAQQVVFDAVVQEIDIPTGLVLFQWDSLDHVPLSDTYSHLRYPHAPFDYFHLNAIAQDDDGNLIISARNTWTAYKVSTTDGSIIWRLGGKHSSFRLGPGAAFAFQHDVRVRGPHDRYITVFDDGAGPPKVHPESRGEELMLDTKHMTARLAWQDLHTPQLTADWEGNVQQLPNFDDFLGWGQQPYFSQYNQHGKLVFDGRFVGGSATYRAYRFKWSGTPRTLPAVWALHTGRTTTVWTSWNGATDVSTWLVDGGSSPTRLRPVARKAKHHFETEITLPRESYVRVLALNSAGYLLASSLTVKVG
jgi:hypothetical protein